MPLAPQRGLDKPSLQGLVQLLRGQIDPALTLLEKRNALGHPVRRTPCYKEGPAEEWLWQRGCTGYRLPTEAEWEYAARAGTTTMYSFGPSQRKVCAYANGADQAAKRKYTEWTVNEACDDGFAQLAPVGHFKPNPWSLYDMHGNVWEWVWDWYGDYPEASPKDYAGTDGGLGRVARGGSLDDVPGWLRSSNRLRVVPTLRYRYIGFRCARGSRPRP